MRSHCSGQYYCVNDSCEVQFIRIVRKEDWIQRRQEREARRQEELLEATKRGDSYPPMIQLNRVM